MEPKPRANATTTSRTRSYIQASAASVAELAGEFGVGETTLRRWLPERLSRPRVVA